MKKIIMIIIVILMIFTSSIFIYKILPSHGKNRVAYLEEKDIEIVVIKNDEIHILNKEQINDFKKILNNLTTNKVSSYDEKRLIKQDYSFYIKDRLEESKIVKYYLYERPIAGYYMESAYGYKFKLSYMQYKKIIQSIDSYLGMQS